MSDESFEEWYLDHTKCGGYWSTSMIQCSEIVWNHQQKKIDDQKSTIDDLRKTVLDFQERYSHACAEIKHLLED